MKPFDLEAAKRGEPIVTRDGREAKFIAHVPEAAPSQQIIYLIGDEIKTNWVTGERNKAICYITDIFMAPKKRTVWVNLYEAGNATWLTTEERADHYSAYPRIGGKAYPIEVEE